MKKALRYWWVVVVAVVVLPAVYVFASVPQGNGWKTRWFWVGYRAPLEDRFYEHHSKWRDGEQQIKVFGFFGAISERGNMHYGEG